MGITWATGMPALLRGRHARAKNGEAIKPPRPPTNPRTVKRDRSANQRCPERVREQWRCSDAPTDRTVAADGGSTNTYPSATLNISTCTFPGSARDLLFRAAAMENAEKGKRGPTGRLKAKWPREQTSSTQPPNVWTATRPSERGPRRLRNRSANSLTLVV